MTFKTYGLTISAWMFGYALGIPIVTVSAWLAVSKSSVHKAHVTFLGLFIGYVVDKSLFELLLLMNNRCILTSFITDLIKNAVGRPRPDLIDRCKPKPGTPQNELVNFDICTETNHHILHDGWRSFPSGHSSFSFAGLGFLALFLAGQMHVFRPRADLFRGLLALAPLLGAAMIAISRCEDYRHDVYDVTIGSILGMGVGYFSYRRYYPRLRHPQCDEPFTSRAAGADERFTKLKDDEEAARVAEEYALGGLESDDDDR